MFSMPPLPSFSNPLAALAGGSTEGMIVMSSDEGKAKVAFTHNPTSFSINRNVSWEDTKLLKTPFGVPQFTGGTSDTLNFQVMVDTSETANATVLPIIDTLYTLTLPKVKDDKYSRPPLVKVEWGKSRKVEFVGVITSVKVDFTLFSDAGDAVRATVAITMLGQANFTATAKKADAKTVLTPIKPADRLK
jgi:hypothetical protein